MNECMDREIREMLPDLVHGAVVPSQRSRIDAHLSTCGECRQELEVLRQVHGAAVFAPAIDVDRIVRRIPPYAIITPLVKRPTPSRTIGWLIAASLAVVIAGGGSVLVNRTSVVESPRSVATATAPYSLALTSGVDDLSDGGLAQLISELNGFDALPTSEPEAVFDVDATVSIDQDSL